MDRSRLEAYSCEVDAAMDVMGGKYKAIIIFDLIDGKKRFSELQRKIPKATARMLSKQLRELESDGIISRTVYPVVPPKTEYSLTEWGETLIPAVKELAAWGVMLFDREGVELPC